MKILKKFSQHDFDLILIFFAEYLKRQIKSLHPNLQTQTDQFQKILQNSNSTITTVYKNLSLKSDLKTQLSIASDWMNWVIEPCTTASEPLSFV